MRGSDKDVCSCRMTDWMINIVCLDGVRSGVYGGASTSAAMGTGGAANMNTRGSKYGDKTEMNFINQQEAASKGPK